jgi:hypothetical protein
MNTADANLLVILVRRKKELFILLTRIKPRLRSSRKSLKASTAVIVEKLAILLPTTCFKLHPSLRNSNKIGSSSSNRNSTRRDNREKALYTLLSSSVSLDVTTGFKEAVKAINTAKEIGYTKEKALVTTISNSQG